MSMGKPSPLIIKGWKIYAHPLFLAQVEALVRQVKAQREKDPEGYKQKNAAKRLKMIQDLMFIAIPEDPAADKYLQGKTLGKKHKQWRRAKFLQQYRLFFRFSSQDKAIVFAWVNDEKTKRAYGSGDDAYAVFAGMLASGQPPDSWEELLAQAEAEGRHLRVMADPAIDEPEAEERRLQ